MVVGVSRGFRDVGGHWLRGWTLWIGALVGAAMFAGAMSGMAYVRNSYEPPVGYSAMNEAELEAARVETSSTPAPPEKRRRAKAPEVAQSHPTPTASPRAVRPKKAPNDAASVEPSEPASPARSESPSGPLAGLEALFSGGERR